MLKYFATMIMAVVVFFSFLSHSVSAEGAEGLRKETTSSYIEVQAKPGQSLTSICRAYRALGGEAPCAISAKGGFIERFMAHNPKVKDPNKIMAGAMYRIPAPKPASPTIVTVTTVMSAEKPAENGPSQAELDAVTAELVGRDEAIAKLAGQLAVLRAQLAEAREAKTSSVSSPVAPISVAEPLSSREKKGYSFFSSLVQLWAILATLVVVYLLRNPLKKTGEVSSAVELEAKFDALDRASEAFVSKTTIGPVSMIFRDRAVARKDLGQPVEDERSLAWEAFRGIFKNNLTGRREAMKAFTSHFFPGGRAVFLWNGKSVALPIRRIEIKIEGEHSSSTEYVEVGEREYNLSKLSRNLESSPELQEKLGLGGEVKEIELPLPEPPELTPSSGPTAEDAEEEDRPTASPFRDKLDYKPNLLNHHLHRRNARVVRETKKKGVIFGSFFRNLKHNFGSRSANQRVE